VSVPVSSHDRPLVIRLCNWVGEAVLSFPALQRLASAGYPLQLVGKIWAPVLFEGMGFPVLVRAESGSECLKQLKAFKGSQSILMVNSFSSALEMRRAGLPAVGFAKECRSPLLRQAVSIEAFPHAAHAYWKLAQAFLGLDEPFPGQIRWEPSREQKEAASALLADRGILPGRFVHVFPFSGTSDKSGKKHWPGFQNLCHAIEQQGMAVVMTPGSEAELAEAHRLYPEANIFPRVNLGVYGAMMQRAHTVVANDTGPGHLAAATGARTLNIFGPAGVESWRPLGQNNTVLWPNHNWPSVDEVLAALGQNASK